MMRKNLPLIVAVVALVLSVVFYFLIRNPSRTAYVDVNYVYDSFKYKKELERQLSSTLDSDQRKIDSVLYMIESSGSSSKEDAAKYNYYLNQKTKIAEEVQRVSREYSNKIW